ncbi:MAG TPA: Ku protein [Candidatus Saccharimonadales bacterium]|nr:Ku protein [Candidatus Saccharimonadales bacterium]
MRPIWTGSISFGLVNVPVHLFSGTNPRQGLDLDMLHKDDHSPIRYARICREDGEEIPWNDIVKGYEYREGDYVVLTKADFEKADPKKSKTIDIQQFVDSSEVDIRYFEKPYYLEPDEGAEKAYRLLHEALERSGKLALALFVIHEREHLGVIKPVGKALVLNQMRWPSDLREGVDLKLPSNEIDEKEVKVALQLIAQQTKPFAPEDFQDTYTDNLEEIIAKKAKGKTPTAVRRKPAEKTNAKDLLQTLKASLATNEKSKK